MEAFLNETQEKNKGELLVDTKIFSKDIILKAAYNFLDRAYFFFKLNKDQNMLVQITLKQGKEMSLKLLSKEFYDELLSVYLRDKLEKENKTIRETIIGAAINNSLDKGWFTAKQNTEENQIDFDKDIDDILKEIENDPDLKIDESEIENILKEIEAESLQEKKPILNINKEGLEQAKQQFNK